MAKNKQYPCGFLSFSRKLALANSFVSAYNVKWDDSYRSEEYQTETHYFCADKSLLDTYFPNQYPEASRCTLSIEFPIGNSDTRYWSAMLSPTKDTNDASSDYDWNSITLPLESMENLLAILPDTP